MSPLPRDQQGLIGRNSGLRHTVIAGLPDGVTQGFHVFQRYRIMPSARVHRSQSANDGTAMNVEIHKRSRMWKAFMLKACCHIHSPTCLAHAISPCVITDHNQSAQIGIDHSQPVVSSQDCTRTHCRKEHLLDISDAARDLDGRDELSRCG